MSSGDWIAVVAALFAGFSALMAWRQANVGSNAIAAATRDQLDSSARASWRGYLELCVTEPFLSSGRARKKGEDDLEFQKYEWFVAVMLDACEAMRLHARDREEWEETIVQMLAEHGDYLCSPDFRGPQPPTSSRKSYFEQYSEELRNLVERACKRYRGST